MTRAELGLNFAVDVQEAGVGTGRLVQCFAVGVQPGEGGVWMRVVAVEVLRADWNQRTI